MLILKESFSFCRKALLFYLKGDFKMCVRGDIYYADLPQENEKSQLQEGLRPIIILSNNRANLHSPVISYAPITSKRKKDLPTHVKLKSGQYGLSYNSIILCEQIHSIDKNKLKEKLGFIRPSDSIMISINKALSIQLGL